MNQRRQWKFIFGGLNSHLRYKNAMGNINSTTGDVHGPSMKSQHASTTQLTRVEGPQIPVAVGMAFQAGNPEVGNPEVEVLAFQAVHQMAWEDLKEG
jgi:hypothetical protein